MASLRKASAYSKKHNRPYTRKSRNKSKAYIKVVPQNKIVKYSLGEVHSFEDGKFKYLVRFLADEDVLIRDNSLESGRLLLNKSLENRLPKQFFLWIKVYPHHILRNNKTAAGAGADRLSSGMKHSFGIVEGRAARVKTGKEIFVIATETEAHARIAREILQTVKAKVPCRSRITMDKIA